MRDKTAQEAPDSEAGMIRRIEQAASAAYPDDMAARFAYRNELRAAAGLKPEERRRGGLAGANDKGFLLPAAMMIAAPWALAALPGAGGAGGAAGAGSAGTAAGTAASTAGGAVPAASTAGGVAGIFKKGADWLSSDTGRAITNLAGTAYGVSQQAKAQDMTNAAVAADRQRWAASAPLREAGMAGLLNPVARDTSSLDRLATQGNPFAAPVGAVPAGGMGAPSPTMPVQPPVPGMTPPGAVPVRTAQPRPMAGGAVPVSTAKRMR